MAQNPSQNPTTGTTFSVNNQIGYLHAANNPMLLTATKSDYQVGQLFYCEIWVTPNKNMLLNGNSVSGATQVTTLFAQGEANKSCTFDISDIVNSCFTTSNYTVPSTTAQTFQKDESCYVQWFVKIGYQYYNAQNIAVKTLCYTSSGNNFAVRAALDSTSGNMSAYYNHYSYLVEQTCFFVTHIPQFAKRGRSEPTLLPFFTPVLPASTSRTLTLEADLYFADGTTDLHYPVLSYALQTGGHYTIDVRPDILGTHLNYANLVRYTVRILYTDDQAPNPLYFSEDRNFEIKKNIQNPRTVVFINTLGGWDALHFHNEYDGVGKPKTSSFKNTYAQRTYAVDYTRVNTYYSSYLNLAEYRWLEDLRATNTIYLDGKYVRQSDADYKIDTSVGLFTYELVVSPDIDKNTVRF